MSFLVSTRRTSASEAQAWKYERVYATIAKLLTAALVLAGCQSPIQGTEPTPTPDAPGVNDTPPDSAVGNPSTTGYFGETLSMSDRIILVVECMEDQGIPAELVPPDGIRHLVPPDQLAQSEAAAEQCLAEVDQRYPRTPPPTKEEEYNAQNEVAECLRENGYEIPPAPTLETWIDSFSDPSQDPWLPYAFLPRLGREAWAEVSKLCPQPIY